MNLTTATPREIDTALLPLLAAEYAAERKLTEARYAIFREAGAKKNYYDGSFDLDWFDALERLQVRTEGDDFLNAAQNALDRLANAQEALDAAGDAVAKVEAEYDRRPWTRAWLVQNNNGHVHRNRYCSTCFSTTRYALIVEYSGADENALVADAGERACTVCYPSAPVDVLSRPTKIFGPDELVAQAAKAERAAAKSAKQAKALAAAITADGSPLVITKDSGYRESFKTERSAVNWLVDSIVCTQAYGYSPEPAEARTAILSALAGKHGESVAWAEAYIAAKVAAKIKRESR